MGKVVPVLLAGGPGARLWPWSTPAHAKPLLDLVGEGPMARATLERLRGLAGPLPLGPALALTSVTQAPALSTVLHGAGVRVLGEPAPRGTAPAATVAALLADPDDVLLVLPADHHVRDAEALRQALRALVAAASDGALALLAVAPTRAETRYGYVELGGQRPGVPPAWRVARFVEKPDAARAAAWSTDGRHRWNAGIFAFRAGVWLSTIDRLAPEVLRAARAAVADVPPRGDATLGPVFVESPDAAIDTAVFEHVDDAVAIGLDAGWSDVGTLGAVHAARAAHPDDNVVVGPAALDGCTGCLVVTDRPVRVRGLVRHAVISVDAGTRVEPLDGA